MSNASLAARSTGTIVPVTDSLAGSRDPAGGRFDRHRGPVTSVVGIPGRRAALSGGYDSAVAWVDLERGTLELLGYHEHLVNAVSVDPSGRRAASASSDYTICLWDLETRRPEKVLRGHFDDVNGFAFCGEDRGASVSHDHRVYLWNLADGRVERVLEGHEKYAMSVDYAEGKIYSSGDDMTLRQWDATRGELLRTWGPFEVETDTCAIDALHQRVVLGADDGHVRIFDCHTGELVGEIEAHASGIKKVAISPTTGNILSAAYDQRLLVWDARTFERVGELESCPRTWERSINWMPDGRQVVAGTFDGTVLVWDADSGRLETEIGGRGETRGNICFNDVDTSPAGELALVSDDGLVRLARLTAERAEIVAQVEPRSGAVLMNGVALEPRSGLVMSGAHDQKLHIFDFSGNRLSNEREIDLGEGPINCIRIADHDDYEGDAFVACYSGALVHVAADGTIRRRMAFHDGAVKALALHPSRPLGVSCSADGGVVAWTFEGERSRGFPAHVAIADDIDLDPNGDLVATVSRDFTLKVFDLEGGQLVHNLSLGQRSPKSVCFFDPETVLVGNYWGQLMRFDLSRGSKTVASIASNGLSAARRCGAHVVVTSYDGAVFLVDPRTLEVVNTLRAMTQRVSDATVSRWV